MDKTETVLEYLKKYPETYTQLYSFLSEYLKVEVKEPHLLKLKLGMLLTYLVPFVESKGIDLLDVLFFANYHKPDYTFLQLQSYSIILSFHRLEKKQPLTFLVF